MAIDPARFTDSFRRYAEAPRGRRLEIVGGVPRLRRPSLLEGIRDLVGKSLAREPHLPCDVDTLTRTISFVRNNSQLSMDQRFTVLERILMSRSRFRDVLGLSDALAGRVYKLHLTNMCVEAGRSSTEAKRAAITELCHLRVQQPKYAGLIDELLPRVFAGWAEGLVSGGNQDLATNQLHDLTALAESLHDIMRRDVTDRSHAAIREQIPR